MLEIVTPKSRNINELATQTITTRHPGTGDGWWPCVNTASPPPPWPTAT